MIWIKKKKVEGDRDQEIETKRERVRSEFYFIFYFFLKIGLLLTVDVNIVCVEGLNWPFFISCGCIWYFLKSQVVFCNLPNDFLCFNMFQSQLK